MAGRIISTIMAGLILTASAGAQETDEPVIPPASPPVLGPLGDQGLIETVEDWEARKPLLRRMFQQIEYGVPPEPVTPRLVEHKVIEQAVPGAASIEQATLSLDEYDRQFQVAWAIPEGDGPHPLVIQISFCGNKVSFGGLEGIDKPLAYYPEFCDRFADFTPPPSEDPPVAGLPLEELLDRGYAVASVYPGDVVPDDRDQAMPILEAMSPSDNPKERLGAIAAWGWVVSRAVDYLETDERLDTERYALLGHSRNGKAALAAAMFDERIDLLWAHQSGTGGVTLSRSYEGEAIENITGGFPHWYAPAFRDYAGREDALPIDQHQALALVAPRPVIIGGAREDTWAGPKGAFASAEGAEPVWELYGSHGMGRWPTSMERFHPHADVAYFIRDGGHGSTVSDWERFMRFLDLHFMDYSGLAFATGITLRDEPGRIILGRYRHPILSFQLAPADGDEDWRRNYIHPLFAPSGAILTENKPDDHVHHRGIFTAWRHIHIDGAQVGDSWVGENVHYGEDYELRTGGVDTGIENFGWGAASTYLWYSDLWKPSEPFMREEMTVSVEDDPEKSIRKIFIQTKLTALTPNVQLGGTDDDKGYGGLSFRFAHPDKMLIESDGEMLTATNAAMQTGETVTFTWPVQEVPADWPQSISVSCTVNGEPWTNWVLRQSLSMQNCAWPGSTLADIPMEEPVTLTAEIIIRQ